MRSISFILLIFLCPFLTFSQSETSVVDSLKNQLNQKIHDTVRFNILSDLAFSYFQSDPTEAEKYAIPLLELGNKQKDKLWRAKALNKLALINHIQSKYHTADSLYMLASEIFEEMNNTQGKLSIQNNLGLLASDQGYSDQAIIHFFRTIELMSSQNDSLAISGVLNNIGIQYDQLKQYEKARDFYLEALDIQERFGRNESYINLLGNLGITEYHLGNYSVSLDYLAKTEPLLIEENNQFGLSDMYYYNGLCFTELGDYQKALAEFERSASIKIIINEKRGLAEVLLGKAQVLQITESAESAKELIDSSLLISYRIGANDIELEALITLSEINKDEKNYDNSTQLLDRYIRLSDSLNNIQKLRDLASAENSYQLTEKQKQLKTLEQNEQINKIKIWRNRLLATIMFAFSGLVAFLLIMYIRRNRVVRKLNIQLDEHSRNLEELVIARTRELEQSMEKVVQSDKLKGFFLANLSHEVRTPLNGILGFAEILIESEQDPTKQSYIKHIHQSGNQLLTVIDRILQLSKIQAGAMEVIKSDIDLVSCIGSLDLVIEKLKTELEPAVSFSFVKEYDEKSPLMIHVDKKILCQVIKHLVHNSIKFTESGYVKYGFKDQGDSVLIFVSDTGIGIKPENFNRIFRPFEHVEDILLKTRRGIGLGLPLSAQLVNLLDSKLEVESELGKGSTFFFSIPKLKNLNTENQSSIEE